MKFLIALLFFAGVYAQNFLHLESFSESNCAGDATDLGYYVSDQCWAFDNYVFAELNETAPGYVRYETSCATMCTSCAISQNVLLGGCTSDDRKLTQTNPVLNATGGIAFELYTGNDCGTLQKVIIVPPGTCYALSDTSSFFFVCTDNSIQYYTCDASECDGDCEPVGSTYTTDTCYSSTNVTYNLPTLFKGYCDVYPPPGTTTTTTTSAAATTTTTSTTDVSTTTTSSTSGENTTSTTTSTSEAATSTTGGSSSTTEASTTTTTGNSTSTTGSGTSSTTEASTTTTAAAATTTTTTENGTTSSTSGEATSTTTTTTGNTTTTGGTTTTSAAATTTTTTTGNSTTASATTTTTTAAATSTGPTATTTTTGASATTTSTTSAIPTTLIFTTMDAHTLTIGIMLSSACIAFTLLFI